MAEIIIPQLTATKRIEEERAELNKEKTPRPSWHNEPYIKPNYGRRKGIMPKSHVKQVLLYDNPTEVKVAEQQMTHISNQQRWSNNILDKQKKNFILRQVFQQESLRAQFKHAPAFLPASVLQAHRKSAVLQIANMHYTGGKDLPMHHRLKKSLIKKTFQAKMLIEDDTKQAEEAASGNVEEAAAGNIKLPDLPTPVTAAKVTIKPPADKEERTELPEITKSVTFVGSPPKTPKTPKAVLTKYSARPRKIRKEHTAPAVLAAPRAVMDVRFKALEKSLSTAHERDGYVMLSSSSWGVEAKEGEGEGEEGVTTEGEDGGASYRPKRYNPLADYKFTKLQELIRKGKEAGNEEEKDK